MCEKYLILSRGLVLRLQGPYERFARRYGALQKLLLLLLLSAPCLSLPAHLSGHIVVLRGWHQHCARPWKTNSLQGSLWCMFIMHRDIPIDTTAIVDDVARAATKDALKCWTCWWIGLLYIDVLSGRTQQNHNNRLACRVSTDSVSKVSKIMKWLFWSVNDFETSFSLVFVLQG